MVAALIVLASIGHWQIDAAAAERRATSAAPPSDEAAKARPDAALGEKIYQRDCASCHQADRAGAAPEFPSLTDLGSRMTDEQITETIQQGLPRMLAFPELKKDEVAGLVEFLKTADHRKKDAGGAGPAGK